MRETRKARLTSITASGYCPECWGAVRKYCTECAKDITGAHGHETILIYACSHDREKMVMGEPKVRFKLPKHHGQIGLFDR